MPSKYFINVVWDDKGNEQYRPDSVVAQITHTGGAAAKDAESTKTSVASGKVAVSTVSFGAMVAPKVMLTAEADEAPAVDAPATADGSENVTISSAMNWHYEWTAKDDGTVWNVIGSEVPHYTLTTQVVDHGWILEYHINTVPTPVPPTGESFPWIAVVLLSVSGIALVVFGVVSRRRSHE